MLHLNQIENTQKEKKKMESSPTGLLLSKENLANLDEDGEEIDGFASILELVDDNEYIQLLLDREINSDGIQMREFLRSCHGDWIERARSDGINYILRKRDSLGFGFQTAYLSVTYLDRFLSKRSIAAEKSWAIRLLAIACLSLAAKMEECVVPLLPELCFDDYSFESNLIHRMEILLLTTLEWKMGSVTPFDFIHFFVKKFLEKSPNKALLSRIEEVILGATRDLKIICQQPFVIAAAATLIVLDKKLTRQTLELKIGLVALTVPLKIEDVISCYYQVQEIAIKSPDLLPLQLQRIEAFGSSSVTSVGSNVKRKRLVFNQSDDYA